MKRFLVLYVCFCLLFSQNAFSVYEGVSDVSSDFDTVDNIEKPEEVNKKENEKKSDKKEGEIKKSIDTTNFKNKKDISKESEDKISDSEKEITCTDQTCLSSAKDIEKDTAPKDIEKNISPKKASPKLNLNQDDSKNTTNNSQINEPAVENIGLNSDAVEIHSNNDILSEPVLQETKSVPAKIIPRSSITKTDLETNIKLLPTTTNEKILITEVQLATSSSSKEEYIELYNPTDKNIVLDGYKLLKNTKSGKEYLLVSNSKFHGTIKSHDYFVITHQNYSNADWANISFSSKNSTISDDSTITLYDKNNHILDRVGFGNAKYFDNEPTSNPPKNESIERKKENGKYIDTDNNENDFKINPCPFPGNYLPANLSPNVRLNEIYANPCDDTEPFCTQTKEFIEIYNPDKISLKNWTIRDASKTGFYTISNDDNETIFALYKKDEQFKFTLNNTNETVTLIAPDCSIASTLHYAKTQKGQSLNYGKTWYNSKSTPGLQNIENPLTKDYPSIYINEILPNPAGDESTDEFIELYNPNNFSVELKNWTLRDASKTGKYLFTTQEIAPLSYFVIYRSDFGFALNNSGDETVSLITPNNKPISSMSYNETREGMSLNRAKNWYFAEISPGAKNVDNPGTKYYQSLQLSELLPNPIGNENTDEFIEIYNPNNTSINLKYWTLKDASKTGSYTFTTDTIIKPSAYFTIYRSEFNFALNNSDETVSLIAPNEKVMSSISYKSSRENISYNYSLTTKNWRWSKHLTPNKENIFNNLPTIKKFEIDNKSYKNVYTDFVAKATDKDGEELKVRWDFGDGRKSYLWETRHKYTKTGTYYGNLRIQDESEEIIKRFIVTVKKYPKYKIQITKIVPNPAGKDSGTEYIIIKNKSNKKIDLKNWSIATGVSNKTIVNHPINKKLIIRPGKSKIITKKYAAISLPNKTGVIEIRRPNSSVADTKEYGDKSISIPDNASYEKIDDKWTWIIPQNLEKIAQTNAIITQAIANEGILSQQKLEQLVAVNAVYNPLGKQRLTTHTEQSIFARIMQKVNILVNQTLVVLSDIINNSNQPNVLATNGPIYVIPSADKPCEKPFITNDSTINGFNFCK